MQITPQPAPDPSVLFRSDWININDGQNFNTEVKTRVVAFAPTNKYSPTTVNVRIIRETESEYNELHTRMAPDTARNLAQQLIAAANACDALEDREAREQASADDVEGVPV